jgi:HD-like signal output (HDOD) protein
MATRRKILFVDEDPNVLDGLRRTFREMRKEWALAFARNGKQALDIMGQVPFDVIISDLGIQGMDGAELLTEVMKKHPGVVRIVLSGETNKEAAMKSINPSHQFLTKPYDSDQLKVILSRAMALRDRLSDDKIKGLVSKMDTLPSMPALYVELMEEVNSEDASIHRVGEIIAHDVGMTAKVMQLVNSAFFGACQNITDTTQAVGRLGLDTVQGLVLSAQIFTQLDVTDIGGFSVNRLWDHSMATGTFSREVAKKEKADRNTMGDAFIAGMLHDSGKLVLASNLPDQYAKALTAVQEKNVSLSDAELMEFGTTHAEVGAYLLGLWGLPDHIVEAVAFHNRPSQCLCHEVSPLTYVHVGNHLEYEIDGKENPPLLDGKYLGELGLDDRIPVWKESCSKFIAPV